MGIALIKLKIMPSSPDVKLDEIKEKGKASIEEKGGKLIKFEEEPIAFGLVALHAYIEVDESLDNTDFVENAFTEIETVTSAEIEDYRRAFG